MRARGFSLSLSLSLASRHFCFFDFVWRARESFTRARLASGPSGGSAGDSGVQGACRPLSLVVDLITAFMSVYHECTAIIFLRSE